MENDLDEMLWWQKVLLEIDDRGTEKYFVDFEEHREFMVSDRFFEHFMEMC